MPESGSQYISRSRVLDAQSCSWAQETHENLVRELTSRIYLVRHGETEANRREIVQGQLDTHLNKSGVEQAVLVSSALQKISFDEGYSSDLSRASKTAEMILECHPHVKLRKQSELRERHLGRLQGQTQAQKRAFGDINSDPTAESSDAFITRSLSWWDDSIRHHLETLPDRATPYRILVVSHGGFISTLIKNLLAKKCIAKAVNVNDWRCYNCSVSIIDIRKDKAEIVQYSDISHLGSSKVVESNADTEDK
ncbi:phosphoglycerate mutase-like protein [Desarmillaria tabescens]|uniref:Phosphoglycerate mutase-like protein n=1 Tax=Armillaria tabescens TaxID=1929756 RepID=A0AA39NDD3_ARMTA|nr:phosphoglycerate mutase-like protein [Desarmillaria tabescens]KAK0463578.1 phosphoglycerate mutase-like protein [Desarmillaria tabescens]